MKQRTAELGTRLDAMRGELADAVVERHYAMRPELQERYGSVGRFKCREDAAYHLSYLAQALTASEPALFRAYVAWAKVMLAGRGIPASDLAENLQATSDVLKDRLAADDASTACGYVKEGIDALSTVAGVPPDCIPTDQPLAELANKYLKAVLACERETASRLILDAVHDGVPIADIYLHVFQRTQETIGHLWQTNKISVAQEHYCTAVTQMIMSQLYPQIFSGPRIGRRFVGACVGGELHEIGLRMVADLLEMDGWDTVYLGANMPIADLVATLQTRKPDVLGLSTTITPHIAALKRTVDAVRAAPGCDDIKILVGGYPFQLVPDLWRVVNADGTSRDARDAVDKANQLTRTTGSR